MISGFIEAEIDVQLVKSCSQHDITQQLPWQSRSSRVSLRPVTVSDVIITNTTSVDDIHRDNTRGTAFQLICDKLTLAFNDLSGY